MNKFREDLAKINSTTQIQQLKEWPDKSEKSSISSKKKLRKLFSFEEVSTHEDMEESKSEKSKSKSKPTGIMLRRSTWKKK